LKKEDYTFVRNKEKWERSPCSQGRVRRKRNGRLVKKGTSSKKHVSGMIYKRVGENAELQKEGGGVKKYPRAASKRMGVFRPGSAKY